MMEDVKCNSVSSVLYDKHHNYHHHQNCIAITIIKTNLMITCIDYQFELMQTFQIIWPTLEISYHDAAGSDL